MGIVFASSEPRSAIAQHANAPTAELFQVVINAANPINDMSREELSKMYLKRVRTWSSGAPAEPLDLLPQEPARHAFSRAVHHRSVSAIRAFWQQQIFSGRDVPPPEKASESEALAFVQVTVGAVAYVSVSAQLPAGVKAIAIR